MSRLIQIVDENDQPVRAATKQEAWDEGLIHRIVRIMLEDSRGRILLQHRDPAMGLFPDCWDHSAAGHVDAGETYEEAAYRELAEEIGIKDVKLTEIGRYRSGDTWEGRCLNRFNKCYRASIDYLPDKLQKGEVDAVQWFTLEEIRRLLKNDPEHVTDGLRQVIERFYSL